MFPRDVKEAIWQRDHGRCAWCGQHVHADWLGWSHHHRRPRGMGGSRRPDTNRPPNGVLLHGHGTVGCHHLVESLRAEALDRGFLVPQTLSPPHVAIDHAVHGLVWLTDDGGWTTTPPEEAW